MEKDIVKRKSGFNCPACDCPETKIYDTRKHIDKVIRTRMCCSCGFLFSTYESCDLKKTFFHIIDKKGNVRRKSFASIKNDVSEFLDDPIKALNANKIITKWVFQQNINKKGILSSYKRRKVYAISQKILNQVYFVTLSKIEQEAGENYYNKQVKKDNGSNITSLKQCEHIISEVNYIEENLI